MKLLVCASARAEVVLKCLRKFVPGNEIILIAPSGVGARLIDSIRAYGSVRMIRLSSPSFCRDSREELRILQNDRFDAAVIVSGGLEFSGFHNVLEAISALSFHQLIFYNSIGRKEIVPIRRGAGRALERYGTLLLFSLFQILRPIGSLAERIYIRCAELLGL